MNMHRQKTRLLYFSTPLLSMLLTMIAGEVGKESGDDLISRPGGQRGDEGFCRRDDPDCSAPMRDTRLHRLSGGEVNHVETLTLKSGNTIHMKTSSMKPLVFEIEDFLSAQECDHLIELAEKTGLQQSQTISTKKDTGVVLRDTDGDRKLTLNEMRLTIEDSFDIYPSLDDIRKMYKDIKLDKNNDELITPDELGDISPEQLEEYVMDLVKRMPHKRARLSSQAWLFPDQSTDEVFINLQQRISELTQLQMDLIKKSDFQVVNYGVDGHYNAHHDSSIKDTKIPCCSRHRKVYSNCRLCRYMTILFYLNDVESGGGTAFPLAGNSSYSEEDFRISGNINLYNHCDKANLVVSPQKGKAVIWYNHFVDNETGWLGELDSFTWHGGCPVIKGTKWIANFWIKTNDDKKYDLYL